MDSRESVEVRGRWKLVMQRKGCTECADEDSQD